MIFHSGDRYLWITLALQRLKLDLSMSASDFSFFQSVVYWPTDMLRSPNSLAPVEDRWVDFPTFLLIAYSIDLEEALSPADEMIIADLVKNRRLRTSHLGFGNNKLLKAAKLDSGSSANTRTPARLHVNGRNSTLEAVIHLRIKVS